MPNRLRYLKFEPALTEALRAELQRYFLEHPKLSLNAFAIRNRLSEATLRRIIKGNLKTSPKYQTVLGVLQAVSKSSSAKDWIQKFPGVIAQFVERNMSLMVSNDTKEPVPELLAELLQDKDTYIAYKLTLNNSGSSPSQIKNVLGLPGTLAIQRLEARGFVAQKKNGRYYATASSATLPNTSFLQNFKNTADHIHIRDRRVDEANLFFNLSNSVNERAYKEILRTQVEAIRKIQKIINDSENIGDIPAFVLTAVDRFER